MFQKSLLKNFIKSFSTPSDNDIVKLVNKDKYIAEDANDAEFILLLSKYLNWDNCVREVKNSTDMKKADGVVYDQNNNPIAIIELKSSDKKTSNRDIIAQAFRYKNEKPTCRFVIVSNFKQLDIYSDSSDVCFSVDMTSSSSYTTLYALLNQTSLETNEIARLKKLSKSQDEITKEVYKEYSSFRLKLLNNLMENNKELSKENIFESANRLLDRFMFILFAEDRGLIPANSIDAIINQYENTKDGWDKVKPLYYYYKKYFHFIDVGNPKVKIPKYNGNLFKPNEQLDSLIIDDNVIKDDLSNLSAYDFSDDIDVEVLGHIFEQSLNDLEKIKESFSAEHKVVNTRKKDGVFYTPKFVTEYIVNNTVAKLCKDKKTELNLFDEAKESKKVKEKRRDTLQEYRKYLESLKIVDPACGSGAFLNACFRFLLNEHTWVQTELQKAGAGLFEHHDIDKQIIEQNLFGVDINGASVGIAKLSLWLQTAKRDRPLSNLMGNIKSANSLTADWSELFPEIMADGGFDCVVGNPPYVRQESIKELKPELKEIYSVFTGTADLFVYFYELAQNVLKVAGINGFICSNKFFRAKYGQKLREMILNKTTIKSIVDFNAIKVFEDATVDSTITILQKGFKENNSFQISLNNYDNFFDMSQEDLTKDSFSFVTPDELAIKKKIEKVGTPLKDIGISIQSGIKTGFNEAFIIDEYVKNDLMSKNKKNGDLIKPILRGKDIKKYEYLFSNKWILLIAYNTSDDIINNYPDIYEWLKQYEVNLRQKAQVIRGDHHWLELDNNPTIEKLKIFKKEKIFYNEIGNSLEFFLDNNNFYCNNKLYFITSDNLNLTYLTAILNSTTLQYYFQMIFNFGGGKGKSIFLNIPIPNIPKSYKQYNKNIDYLINLSHEKRYDRDKKFAIININNRELYITEFLFAKQRGYIEKYTGHVDLDLSFYRLLPYLSSSIYITLENSDDKRVVYGVNLDNKRTLLIAIDDDTIVSIFIQNNKNLAKQIKNGRFKKISQLGETTTPLTLKCPAGSCLKAFWRQTDLLELLYQKLSSKSISQEPFIALADTIIDSKEKIAKYNKHFDSLNAVDKIEIKEEIEKLDILVQESVDEVDRLVYGLYGLSDGEIGIVEVG